LYELCELELDLCCSSSRKKVEIYFSGAIRSIAEEEAEF
jgi:hypothetical protein